MAGMGWRAAGFNGAAHVAFSPNDLKCSQTLRHRCLDHASGWELPLLPNLTAGKRHLLPPPPPLPPSPEHPPRKGGVVQWLYTSAGGQTGPGLSPSSVTLTVGKFHHLLGASVECIVRSFIHLFSIKQDCTENLLWVLC